MIQYFHQDFHMMAWQGAAWQIQCPVTLSALHYAALLPSCRTIRTMSTRLTISYTSRVSEALPFSFSSSFSLSTSQSSLTFYPYPTLFQAQTCWTVSPEQAIMKRASEERGTNSKWSSSRIIEELRRRHVVRRVSGAPGVRQSILAILKRSWLNVLLLLIPFSWIFHFLKLYNTLVFVFSFLALIPLARLLAFATEELSLRLGITLACLLNSTLRNAVELIVAIIALVKCELHVVQASLIGTILSNLLLVLGMCFFTGGTRFSEQGFGMSATQLNSSLLTLSVIAVLLPAAFHSTAQPSNGVDPLTDAQEAHDILAVSRGVAIVLLFVYFCFLVFQLFSHKNLYEEDCRDIQMAVRYTPALARTLHTISTRDVEAASHEEEENPQLSTKIAIALLVSATVIVAITAESLVDSIDGLTSNGRISKEFVGLILNPTVGDAAEILTENIAGVPVSVSLLSLGVAVGKSVQIALFVIPFVTILGWMLRKPLSLLFDPFESIVLFLSVLTVNYVVRDGRSNWLKGMILICLYVIIGVMFWYYSGSDPAGVFASCR